LVQIGPVVSAKKIKNKHYLSDTFGPLVSFVYSKHKHFRGPSNKNVWLKLKIKLQQRAEVINNAQDLFRAIVDIPMYSKTVPFIPKAHGESFKG